MTEQVLRFGANDGLVGIVTHPVQRPPAKAVAVILLNAGIVHRPGPNRVNVALARRLAALGLVVLRFDFSGVGDSETRTDAVAFGTRTIEETRHAMDALTALTGVRRFVLAGICAGAHVAVAAAARDERAVGVVSINHAAHRGSGGRDFARTMVRHYTRLILSSSFGAKNWRKALAGQIDLRRLAETGRSLVGAGKHGSAPSPRVNPFIRDLRVLAARETEVLLVHSESDEGLDYTNLVLRRALGDLPPARRPDLQVIRGANHTFTLVPNQRALVGVVADWAGRFEHPRTSHPLHGRRADA